MKPSILDSAVTGLVSDPDLAEVILGDLEELHAERAERQGHRAARWWLWGEFSRSVPALLLRRLREAPVRIVLSALLGMLIMWTVQVLFALASSYLPQTAGYTAFCLFAGHLVGGLAAGAAIATVNRVAPLAAALWVIPCWILGGFLAVALTAATAVIDPGSAPASAEISLAAAVHELLAITGIVVGAVSIVVRPRRQAAY